ncbi:MAG: hypothetical protein Q9214_004816 [Letrouitia sp. 1 TL-2023]
MSTGVSFYIAFFSLLLLLYILYTVVYRLYLSPLAKYPGPKIAALTSWYEFYHDILRHGRFPWEVQRLHDIYGPVVRITPNEIHVRDPDFWDELMTTSARPRDKTEFLAGLTGRQSVFGTVGHDLHHIRRGALNAFSSKKSIAGFEPRVRERVAELCNALMGYADSGNVINLNTAFTALALDVISLYAFGKSYGLLQRREFAPDWRQMLHNTLESFPLMRHMPWLPAILKKLPSSIRNLVSKDLALCLELEVQARRDAIRAVENQKQVLLTKEEGSSHERSIFEELVISDLPPAEKSVDRLSEEGFILIIAGGDVSAMNLAMLSYHLLANPDILSTLTAELREAIPELGAWPMWQELEVLPYLVYVSFSFLFFFYSTCLLTTKMPYMVFLQLKFFLDREYACIDTDICLIESLYQRRSTYQRRPCRS